MPLQGAQAHLGGGMGAGAEAHAGIEHDTDAVLITLGLHPFRHHQQAVSHGDGAIILLPAVLPVLVAYAAAGKLQGTGIQRGKPLAHGAELGAERVYLRLSGRTVLQIDADAAHALHGAGQRLVHIIPVLTVLLKKGLEIRFIVQN